MQAPGQAPVKTIGLHQHPETLFPSIGLPAETGGPGAGGSAVNVALPAATGDASWLRAFHAIVPPLLRRFRPQILVSQLSQPARPALGRFASREQRRRQ